MKQFTFEAFRKANVTRCLRWHPKGLNSWSSSDWITAVTGELGELASLIKMRNRERDQLPGNKFSPTDKQVADEIADVFAYLDLLAASLGVDLGAAAVSKFNEVSERVGLPDRIDLEVNPQVELSPEESYALISAVKRGKFVADGPHYTPCITLLDLGLIQLHRTWSFGGVGFEATEKGVEWVKENCQ